MEREIFAPAYFDHHSINVTHASLSAGYGQKQLLICPEHVLSSVEIISLIFYGGIFFFGFFGNCLIVNSILKYPKMMTNTNFYVLNLTVANQLVIFLLPLEIGWIIIGNWPFGNSVCKIFMGVISINLYTNSIFLMVMIIDRYMIVGHPQITTKFRTRRVVLIISVICWSIATVISAPAFWYSETFSDECNNFCDFSLPETELMKGHSIFVLYTFILSFAFPLSVSFGFYALMLSKRWKYKSQRKDKRVNVHRKLVKFVVMLTITYAICWIPYWIRQFVIVFSSASLNVMFIALFILLTGLIKTVHCAANTIVCFIHNNNFNLCFQMTFQRSTEEQVNMQLELEDNFLPMPSETSDKVPLDIQDIRL